MHSYPSILALLILCATWSPLLAQVKIFYNQVGYSPKQSKILLVQKSRADSLYVYKSKGDLQGTYPLSKNQYWEGSNDSVRVVDLSAIHDTGTFRLAMPMANLNYRIRIQEKPLTDLTNGALKFFYYQRASFELTEVFAGPWHRAAGHPDTLAILHPSTGDSGVISSTKGWYDAGDYGKYIVNSGISMYTLLKLFEEAESKFKNRTWNIPESSDQIPDLLNEMRWNLDWMLTMQAKDGGVYHKLTSLRFCGDIAPVDDLDARYAIGKSTTAAMNFAAVMAFASRIYAPWDKAYSETMLKAAKKAYAWGLEHPNVPFNQPHDVQTGQYGDQNLKDEIFWASAEMLVATKDLKGPYLKQIQVLQEPLKIPSWQSVNALGYFTMALHPKLFGPMAQRAKDQIFDKAQELLEIAQKNPYHISLENGDFVWGSNAIVANHAIVFIQAHKLKPNIAFKQMAQSHLDYILGKNPLGLSYVTGFGSNSVRNPHHRPSVADLIADPVPGMLAGGPHEGGQDISTPDNPVPWKCQEYRVDNAPAKSFIDHKCSYATNEVAINWNAPLAYLSAMLED